MNLRRPFTFIACIAVLLAVQGYFLRGAGRPEASLAGPYLSFNLGRACYNIVDFGADPTGSTDSTMAIQAAINLAAALNGVGICAPAGTFELSRDVTLYSAGAGGGGTVSIFGAGAGLTTFLETSQYSNVFDSCPDYSNVTHSMPIPSDCPAVSPTGAPNTPNPNVPLVGAVLSNFSIEYSPAAATPPPGMVSGAPIGWGPSAVYFPKVAGLLISNVSISSAYNCFDFGEQQPLSFRNIVVRDSVGSISCTGHAFAVHGGGAGLSVSGVPYSGGNGTGSPEQLFQGIAFDLSDVGGPVSGSQTIYDQTWDNNDLENLAWGTFGLVSPGSGLIGARWMANTCGYAAFPCHYFATPYGGSSPGQITSVTLNDKSATSWYTAIYVDGGNNTPPLSAPPIDIQIGAPSLYAGSQVRPYGASFFVLVGTQDPLSSGSAVTVKFAGGTPLPVVLASSSDTARSLAGKLAAAYGCATAGCTPPLSPMVAQFGSTTVANQDYGLVSMFLFSPPASGTFDANAYTVYVTGSLRLADDSQGAICTFPYSGYGSSYCQSEAFDVGDGLALWNGAQNVRTFGSTISSNAGAAIHLWPSSGSQFRATANLVGLTAAQPSYIGFAAETNAKTDIMLADNDLSNATIPIQVATPLPSPLPTGAPIIRSNSATFSTTRTATVGGLTYTNDGPLDCYYYVPNLPTGGTMTLTYPSGSAVGLANDTTTVFVPVGATLTISVGFPVGSVSGICLP